MVWERLRRFIRHFPDSLQIRSDHTQIAPPLELYLLYAGALDRRADIQGDGRQNRAGDVKRSYGGRELSKLTVFWKIIVRLRRQNPVRRVRKPRLGRVVPRRRPL